MGQALGVVSTVTAATALVLTKDSAKKNRFTGTTTHTLRLPVVDDLELGVEYTVFNSSTGVVTVTNSATTTVTTVAANTVARITLVDKTSPGVWIVG